MLDVIALSLLLATPKVGDIAPDFTVQDTDGKTHKLSEMTKRGTVVLAFFPKAFTGTCTDELESYRDNHAALAPCKGQVLAISTDDLETQKRFKSELGAPFPFIADPDAKLVNLYDVKTPVVTYAKRRTFVIGKDRKILQVDEGDDAADPKNALKACGG